MLKLLLIIFKLNYLGEKTFEYIKKYVDELINVSEDIILSIIYLMEKQYCIVEGTDSVPVVTFMIGKIGSDR